MGSTRLLKKTKTNEGQLTDRERRFVEEYLSNGYEGTKAAIAAGYSVKTASVMASKLLKKNKIEQRIGVREKALETEYTIGRKAVLEQLLRCLTRDVADYIDPATGELYADLRKIPRHARDAIDGITEEITYNKQGEKIVTRKLKLVGKASVIDMAMKHKGLFEPEKLEVKHGLDWTSLYRPPIEVDPVEKRITEGE